MVRPARVPWVLVVLLVLVAWADRAVVWMACRPRCRL